MDRGGHYHPHLVHYVCLVPADHSWGGEGEPHPHPAELRRVEGRQCGGRDDDFGSRLMGGGGNLALAGGETQAVPHLPDQLLARLDTRVRNKNGGRRA